MKTVALVSLLVIVPAFAGTGSPATAGPSIPVPAIAADASLVEKVRRDCTWVDNKWTYQRGDKRLVCRPDRPSGAGWRWHREGNRYGWHNRDRNAWHHNAW